MVGLLLVTMVRGFLDVGGRAYLSIFCSEQGLEASEVLCKTTMYRTSAIFEPFKCI